MIDRVIHYIILIILFFILPVLAGGIIRKVRARAQGRKGPPVLQNLNDVIRSVQKTPVDGVFSGIFSEVAPVFIVFASFAVWTIVVFEWTAFIFIPFFLVMQRLCITGFAMETGTSFGGLGTSRETLLSIIAEPTIILVILVAQSKMNLEFTWVGVVLGMLFLFASVVAFMAEMARPPFDDPRTHLELTMVHEAMLLEASGRTLAFFEIAYQLKIASFLVLIIKIALEHSFIINELGLPIYASSILALLGGLVMAAGIGFWESICARRKWSWVPEIMGLTFLFLLVLGTLVKLEVR